MSSGKKDSQEHVVVQRIIFKYLYYAAFRAMTGSKWDLAVMLFGIFPQLLKFCGALIVHSTNNFLIAPLVDGLSIYPTIL